MFQSFSRSAAKLHKKRSGDLFGLILSGARGTEKSVSKLIDSLHIDDES